MTPDDPKTPASRRRAPANFSAKPARAPVAVVTEMHELAAWIIGRVAKYPKDLKYTLGHRTIDVSIAILEGLVEAAYLPASVRSEHLAAVNRAIERLRHLVRLAHTLAALPHDSYAHVAERIDGVGRQVGGWMRARGPAQTEVAG